MSRAEVEAILGPPGDYRRGLGETDFTTENMGWMPDKGPVALSGDWSRNPGDQRLWAFWLSDSIEIAIATGQSGSVEEKVGLPRRTTQGPLDNLLWRLKRQWRRWFPE
jgi:hypothetical protein